MSSHFLSHCSADSPMNFPFDISNERPPVSILLINIMPLVVLQLLDPPLPAVVWPVDQSPLAIRSPRTSLSKNGTDAEKLPKRYGSAIKTWPPNFSFTLLSFLTDSTASQGVNFSPRATGDTRIAYKQQFRQLI